MPLFSRRHVLAQSVGAAVWGAAAPGAKADRYPSRIRFVIPYAAGGSGDQIGRPWVEKISELLGPVVVENIGGAGGAIGCAAVLHEAPDGYSLLLGNVSTQVIGPLTSAHPSLRSDRYRRAMGSARRSRLAGADPANA